MVSPFFCEFFAKKFKNVKTGTRSWQKYKSFCPNKLKIWVQAVQGSSIA